MDIMPFDTVDQGRPAQATQDKSDGNVVRFFTKEVYLAQKSEELGKPHYREGTFIEVRAPGHRDIFCDELKFVDGKPVDRKGWVEKYPAQWGKFKAQKEQIPDGTPIEMWPNPKMDRGRVAEFKARGVHTVEQLASISDLGLQDLGMGARELRTQAELYLGGAENNAKMNQLVTDNEKLMDRIIALEDQIHTLGVDPKEITTAPAPVPVVKKRRGRPKKVTTE